MMLTLYCALSFACLLLLLIPTRRLSTRARAVLATSLVAVSLLPLNGVSLAGHWRATVGEPAVTTAVLLLMLAWNRLRDHRPTMPARLRHHIRLFGVFALFFYPLTLGISAFDPYRLGYTPHLLLLLVMAATLWCWYHREFAAASMLAVATLMFSLSALTSNNYWDYLIDPMLGLFGLGLMIKHLRHRWRWRRQRAAIA